MALAAAFLLAGSGAAWTKLGDRELSYALAAAGLVLVGVWVAVEVTRIAHALHEKEGALGEVDGEVDGGPDTPGI
jgi:type VI protein secretion system component VasK